MRPAYFIRINREESLGTVATATGLDPDTISAFERGETRRPAPKTLTALAKHYDVTVEALLEAPDAAPRAVA